MYVCVFFLQTVLVGSYLIAHGFFSVYAMCVDTLFLCFCEYLPLINVLTPETASISINIKPSRSTLEGRKSIQRNVQPLIVNCDPLKMF